MNIPIDFIRITDFLQKGNTLQLGDHLYENDKTSYPTGEDFDFVNYYYVTGIYGANISIYPMSGTVGKKIELNTLNDCWFVLELPITVRKALGIDNL